MMYDEGYGLGSGTTQCLPQSTASAPRKPVGRRQPTDDMGMPWRRGRCGSISEGHSAQHD